MTLLALDGLTTRIELAGHAYDVVRDVSLALEPGETLAIVGESGCGKSLLAMSIMGLLPRVARVAAGEVRLDGRRISGLPERAMRAIRGGELGMVFQEPMTALNPVLTVGDQVAEPLRDHRGLSARAAAREAVAVMERVRIPGAAGRLRAYPHEFSGGMRQRVAIALAIACRPKVLIADEPTTALDVTVQRQILDLLGGLQRADGLALLLITHNLGLVARHAGRVAVMYGGDVVETAAVAALFDRPAHPYTRALLAALPRVDRDGPAPEPIPGQVPTLPEMPEGCRFQNRCPARMPACATRPPLTEIAADHHVRCRLYEAAP